jgi:putative ABC transport system permease protein
MLKTAIKFILYDKAKSFGALMGIIISTFLVGQQTGIFLFLTDSMSRLVDKSDAQLWVVDTSTKNVGALTPIDVRKLREVGSIPGIKKAYPLVIAGSSARFSDGTSAGVQLIGVELPDCKGGPTALDRGTFADLATDGAVAFDTYDRKAFNGADIGTSFEIGGRRAYLAAATKGYRGFGAQYMLTTVERARYLGNFPQDKLSAVLVYLEPGIDSIAVRDAINKSIFGVRAWLPQDFSSQTKVTVLSTTGIAISIGTLLIFAVISGFFIIGLTLYSAAIDRIRDYGTLKAIGATNGYITRLILLQALLFTIVGFTVGMGLAEFFRFGIAKAGTIFQYTWLLRFAFLLVTTMISLGGATFAVRRINGVEPASVFRG